MKSKNVGNDHFRGLSRRNAIKTTAAASLGVASGAFGVPQAGKAPSTRKDYIREENSKKGTRDWRLTKTKTVPGKINKILDNGRSKAIEGYCNTNSLRAGEKLKIMVSANPTSAFKLEIFRTGYYGGTGARLMKSFDSLKAGTQPDPPIGENYLRECQWEPTVELEIPKTWPSGVYLGKMTAERSGVQSLSLIHI